MRWKLKLVLFLILFNVSLVSASFSVGNKSYSIETSYSPGEELKGWINISLSNEPASSKLASSTGGNISLLEFLEEANLLSKNSDFSCIPKACNDNYATSNGQASKGFSLTAGEEKILAFKLVGTISSVNGLEFNVSVTNSETCISPVKIDMFDDEDYNWRPKKYIGNLVCKYGDGYGCFDLSTPSQSTLIDDTPYCEKIKLVESGLFSVGAFVSGTGTWSNGLLKMFVYDLDGGEMDNCDLPQPSAAGSEINCTVNFPNNAVQEYYVCLQAREGAGVTNYETKREDVGACGFYADPGQETEYHDYHIFARGAKYGNIGEFRFNQAQWETQENTGILVEEADTYVFENYNKNCSAGCSIPIRFKAFQPVSVVVKDIRLTYSAGGGSQVEDEIYDVSKEPAKINSKFLKLDLEDSGLRVPSAYGNHTISLSLAGSQIFGQSVIVIRTGNINSVWPLEVAAAVPTTFNVEVEMPTNTNITKYVWNFGTSNSTTTTKSSVSYAYPDIGSYKLKITITDTLNQASSKEFTVKVNSPEFVVNKTIKDYRKRVDSLKANISNFPSWYKTIVEDESKIDSLDGSLRALEIKNSLASTDDNYIEIMKGLVSLEIPKEVKKKTGSYPKLVYEADIDLDVLSELGAGNDTGIEKEVAEWHNTNMDVKLDYETVYLIYDSKSENIASIFKLKIKPKEDLREGYLVLDEDLSNAKWNEDYKEKLLTGKTGIVLDDLKKDEEKIIEFANAYIDSEGFVIYIGKNFEDYVGTSVIPCNSNKKCEKDLGEDYKNCRSDCKPWGWVIFWIILILIIFFVVYIILQIWYKRNYEKNLFKDRNDLFNLVNFINNSKAKGMGESEIKEKLKNAGWRGEQISYALKKAKGKFVGMKELPFIKMFKKPKKLEVGATNIPPKAGPQNQKMMNRRF